MKRIAIAAGGGLLLVGAGLLACAAVLGLPDPQLEGEEASVPPRPSSSTGLPEAGAGCDPFPPRCESDAVVSCTPARKTQVTPCSLGCDASSARCKAVVSSTAARGVDIVSATFTAPIDGAGTVFIDTATGFIGRRNPDGTPAGVPIRAAGNGLKDGVVYAVVDQAEGPKLAVFGFAELVVGVTGVVNVVGPHAVTLTAKGSIAIDGRLSVRGDCAAVPMIPGPGGFAAERPPTASDGLPGGGGTTTPFPLDPVAYPVDMCGGCGGGGNGGAGSVGGAAADPSEPQRTGLGGAAGKARAKSIIDKPILSGGAAGGGLGKGGAGGGALGLVATDLVRISGVIDAGGCGGAKAGYDGVKCAAPEQWAGGGGAGGTLFFEAIAVVVTAGARVLANGGGGGGGANLATLPKSGDDASNIDATAALGGASVSGGSPCNPGGRGSPFPAVQSSLDCGNPRTFTSSVRAAGAGGGAGHIAARTKDGTVTLAAPAIVSPALIKSVVQLR